MQSILLIDNYDSFTFNLQHLIEETQHINLTVRRNDESFLLELEQGIYSGVVIGPGPGSPENLNYFGHNQTVIQKFGTQNLPLLGVCLGFQGIYSEFGGSLKEAPLPMHGKISQLDIPQESQIFKGIKSQINVMRYHSIIADLNQPFPDCLKATAYAKAQKETQVNGLELMAIEHQEHPIFGVQFHPESFATDFGKEIITNFLEIC